MLDNSDKICRKYTNESPQASWARSTTEQTSSKTLTFKVHQTAKNAFSPLQIAADFFSLFFLLILINSL